MSTAEPSPAGTAAHAKVLEAEHELEQATSARPQHPARLAAALEQAVDACRRCEQPRVFRTGFLLVLCYFLAVQPSVVNFLRCAVSES